MDQHQMCLIYTYRNPLGAFSFQNPHWPAKIFYLRRKYCYTFIAKYQGLKTIFTEKQIDLTIQRLAHQVLETHLQLEDTVIIGMQPRGVFVSDKLVDELQKGVKANVQYGKLDITFYRDDVRNELHVPNKTEINFSIENKKVILVDDVLYTGRTIRAALDALLDFGRPAKVELCVLIDRRFSRQLPIQPDYVGKIIDALVTQKVKVQWKNRNNATQVIITE